MKKTIKICSLAVVLGAFAGTASAQIFIQGDWSGTLPNISQAGYTDGATPASSILGEPAKFGAAVEAAETGGNPGSFLSFGSYNTVWAIALEHNPNVATYEFNFDYIINSAGSHTRWEVIGVEAGQTVTGVHAQLPYGGIHASNPVDNGPAGGTLLASGDLGGVTSGWVELQGNAISVGEEYSSVIFRINRNGLNSGPFGAGFDNITIIPEPSTYAAFFGVFVLGIALWRRRSVAQR